MSTPKTLDLCKILCESRCIIKSQVHHFQALFLFLLPCSFSIIIYPVFQKIISKSLPDSTLPIQILINLLYIFFVPILSICAVAPISYSTFHAFYGKPVELITSIKSIFHSFFPLLSTLIIQELGLALIFLPSVYQYIRIYGSESFYNSNSDYKAIIIFLTLLTLLVFIYLQVKWILVFVIVVMESKWGSEATQRSSHLVKGKGGVAFSMVLLFDLMVGAFFLGFYAHGLRTSVIFYMIISWIYLTMVFLLNLVANVVFYVYCMEIHGQVLPYSSVEQLPLLN